MKKRKSVSKRTFTKKVVAFALVMGCIGGILPYILSFFDKSPVESLGVVWVTEVFAVVVVYCCKSYFETKQEQKQQLDEYKATMRYEGTEEEP